MLHTIHLAHTLPGLACCTKMTRLLCTATTREKLVTPLTFPTAALHLHPFMVQGWGPCTSSGEAPIYDLKSVASHKGGIGGGHYHGLCRNSDDGAWYVCLRGGQARRGDREGTRVHRHERARTHTHSHAYARAHTGTTTMTRRSRYRHSPNTILSNLTFSFTSCGNRALRQTAVSDSQFSADSSGLVAFCF